MPRGLPGRAGVGAAIAAAVLLAFAPAGHGDTNLGTENGITYISDETPISPNQPAAPDAACPPGTELVGGGGESISNESGGILSGLRPEDDGDANARPDDGITAFAFNTIDSVRNAIVWAFCAPGKVQYPSRHRILPLGATRTTKVPCPRGTRVLSGGVALDGLNSDVHLLALLPFDDGDRGSRPDDGWKVRASNVGGADKQFTTWAFCRDGVPVDYPQLDTPFPIGPNSTAGDAEECSDQAHSLVGVGAQIGGSPNTRRVSAAGALDITGPSETGTVPDDRGFVDVQNNSASGTSFGIHPICARF